MFFTELTNDEVTSTYALFRFLEKLKVIGHLMAHTEQLDKENGDIFGRYLLYDFTEGDYSIIKDGYTSQPRSPDAMEQIEQILHKKFVRFNRRP
jgi:hypothetical protein